MGPELTGRQIFSTQARLQNPAAAAQFSTDGRLLGRHPRPWEARIWEIAPANEYRTLAASPLKGKRAYRSVAITVDGRLLAAGADGGFALWDLPTGMEVAFLAGSPIQLRRVSKIVHRALSLPRGKRRRCSPWR